MSIKLTSHSDLKTFIRFFEAIPEDKWCEGYFEKDGKCCARGHVGAPSPADDQLLRLAPRIATANNGNMPQFRQKSIKRRVLAYLNWLLKGGNRFA